MSEPTEIVTVRVEGSPVQQGNLSTGRQGQQYWTNGPVLRKWRELIAKETREVLPDGWEPTLGPIGLSAVFIHKRPKTGPNSKRKTATYKVTSPDLDKLIRALLDALTGVVYVDDCQVADIHAVDVFSDSIDDTPDEGLVYRAYRL